MCTSSTRKSGKGRHVKIITDNSVETVVLGNTEMNNDSRCCLNKLSLLCHRGGEEYEYACPLTLGTESCQSMRHQNNFCCCNFVNRTSSRRNSKCAYQDR